MEFKTTEEISVADYTTVANKKWANLEELLERLEFIYKQNPSPLLHCLLMEVMQNT